MASSTFSVGGVADVLRGARHASEGAGESVCLRVVVDQTAPRELVCAVRDALVAERVGGEVSVRALSEGSGEGFVADACVVVCGEGQRLVAQAASAVAARGIPCALVAESALSVPPLSEDARATGLVSAVVGSTPETATDKLATWLVDATRKHLAMAANFPFCRRAESARLTRSCALSNTAVGVVDLVPGADFPVMCVRQAKLALDMAAAYGKPMEPARALDVALVLGCGAAWRSAARLLVGAAPGAAWMVRGGVAWAGTHATSWLLRLRLEGVPEGPASRAVLAVGDVLADVRDGVAGLVSRLAGGGSGEPAAGGAVASLADAG